MNSMKKFFALPTVLAAGYLSTTDSHAQNLVTNPSFEAGSTSAYTATGWTFSSTSPTAGAPLAYVPPEGGYVATPSDGTRLLIFNAGGDIFTQSVSQDLTTVVGTTYNVTLNAGVYSNGSLNKNQRLLVTASGATSGASQTFPVASTSGTATLPQQPTYSFVAGATTTTLTLADNSTGVSGNTFSDLLVDNVRVTVAVPNTAPTAVADTYAATQNTALVINSPGVLTNDTDPQSDTLTAVLDTNVSHGTLALNPNGGFTYTPTTGYIGADYFTYHANDGSLNSSVVTVTLNVAAPNIVTNGSFELGSPADNGLLTNWTIGGTGNTPVGSATGYTAIDGTRVAVFNRGGENFNGTITQNLTTVVGQTYALTFNVGITAGSGKRHRVLVTAASLSQSYEVTSTSGAINWAAQSVNFTATSTTTALTFADNGATVSPASAAQITDLLLDNVKVVATPSSTPVAIADSYAAIQSTALVINAANGVLANDTDPQNDPLTAALGTTVSHGTLSLASNGGFTYTPTTGYTGPDSFTYRANDGALNSGFVTVSISVTAPGTNLLTNGGFEPGTPADFGSLDGWTVTGTNTTPPYAPTGFTTGSGYTPIEGLRFALFNAGGAVYDGTIAQSVATIPGQAYTLSFKLGVKGNSGKKQRILASAGATSQSFEVTSTSNTLSTWTAAQTLGFTATGASTLITFADNSGTITSSAADSDLLLDDVQLVAGNGNTAPVAVADSYSTTQNVALNISAPGVLANDTDAQSNPLTAVLGVTVAHGTLTLNSNGSFLYTPTTGYTGADSFTYRANDGSLNSSLVTVSLTVTAPTPLTNGGFELGSPADFGTLTGWTITGTNTGPPFAPTGYTTGGGYSPIEGLRFALFNAGGAAYDGTIAQSVSTTNGQAYTLSFKLGIRGNTGKKQRILVSAGATSQSFEVTSTSNTLSTWTAAQTLDFTATSGTTLITFADNSGTITSSASDSDLLLDDVQLAVASGNTAPVAVADSYSTTQNVALNISAPGVLANDTDAQSNSLTAILDATVAHGTLALNANGSFLYTPTTGYTGSDSFTYHANDGSLNSSVVTVSLTVTAPTPLTNGGFELGSPADFGTLTGWTITGTNTGPPFAPTGYTTGGGYAPVEGLRFALFNAGGAVYDGTIAQSVTTTTGQAYSLTFKVGIRGAVGKKQRVLVSAGATSQSFEITSTSASVSTWSATQTLNFTAASGTTLLTFADNSGTITSSASDSDLQLDDVQLAVANGNTAPVAIADSYSTTQNLALNISAPGVLSNDTDAQSNSLTAILDATVAHGTLTLNANGSFLYTPTTGYTGADSFTYHANDGTLNSSIVTVSLTVNAPSNNKVVNGSFENGSPADLGTLTGWTITGTNTAPPYAPVGYGAHPPSYVPQEGTRLALFNAGGSVFDGSIAQTIPTTAGQSYNLTFKLGIFGTSGKVQSVQVSATGATSLISPANGLKSITSNSNTNGFWTSQTITFIADSSSTILKFADASTSPTGDSSDLLLDDVQLVENLNVRLLTVNSSPANGFAVTVTPPDLSSNGNGTTSFTRNYQNLTDVTLTAVASVGPSVFQKWQKDGADAGTNTAITVTMDAAHTMTAVYIVDNSPRATADSYTATEDTQLSVTAPGVLANDTDPNSAAITAVLDTTTSHGTLVLNSNGSFTYNPDANYNGPDSFTYHAANSTLSSSIVAVNLTVGAVNDLPIATPQTVSTDEDVALPITLTGSDLDGDSLTFAIGTAPAHGSITGTAPNITYTPAANYNGPDSFTFTASDASGASAPATVSITVISVPDAPVAAPQSVSLTAATSKAITLAGTDADSDPLTYAVATQPGHGTLTGTAPNLTYVPVANYVGTDTFTFTANDGTLTSTPATVTITVNSVIANGSFEAYTGALGTSTLPTSWTVSGNYEIAASITGTRPSTDGTILVVFNSVQKTPNAVFSQSFATTPGQPYLLQFDQGVQAVPAGTQILKVNLSNSNVAVAGVTYTINALANTSPNWTARSLSFIATGTTSTLTFTDSSGAVTTNIDQLLDNVRITPQLTRLLTVNSTPATGAAITVSPADITSAGNGTTNFTRNYLDAAVVNLTAPGTLGTSNFSKWQRNGVDFAVTAATSVTMNAAYTMTAVYVPNAPPVATADSYSTNEDTQLTVNAPGVLSNDTDPESKPITAVLDTTTTNGTLVLNATGSFTYTPAANYNGPDSFTYHASDGIDSSAIVTVSINVNPVNDLPVATAQTGLTVPEDGSLPITLAGTDVEGSALTFTVVAQPTHGTLTGTLPNLTYTPALNYNGPDSFTFKANDGTADSATNATVSITVTPVNDLPVANAQSVNADEDVAKAITLVGTDVDVPTTLTYTIVAQPTHGTLTGTAPNVTYTSALNYNGPDSFTFKVNDGTADSNTATVSITVAPINDAPVATPQTLSVAEDGSLSITLAGTDVDTATTLTFTAGSAAHGTITGTAPNLTYTPALNYNGPDSFTFTANDGTVSSAPATISITVTPVNDVPVATAQSVTVTEDVAKSITLAGTDVDVPTTLTYTVVTQPANGTLTGIAPNLTYTPALNYNGPDSFTFKVNDGTVDSAANATVSITVTAVNDEPVAAAQSVNADEDVAKAITLVGTDVDVPTTLTYTIVDQPAHGTLTGTAPNVTYVSALNYNGPDSFTFKVNDGTVDSAVATVTITVAPINDAPIAIGQSVDADEDVAKAITLAGTDVDVPTTLTYTIVDQPTHGTLTGIAPNVTYTSALNYNGPDSFTFKVNDGTVDSAVATVTIMVAPINDAPVAVAQSVNADEDVAKVITLIGTDVDVPTTLGYTVVSQPANGILSGTAPNLTYTPNLNYNGPDSFTFKVNDGTVDSAVATVTIVVAPINDAPVAAAQSVTVGQGGSVGITLAGSDVDSGTTLTFTASTPAHGVLTGTAPNLTYTPTASYSGPDSFTFTVNDGTVDSTPATVTITVTATGFNQWMAGFGLNAGPKVDSDFDGISNLVEFVLGGNPATIMNSSLLPTASLVTADPDNNTVNDNYVLFTYRRTELAKNDAATSIKTEWSTSLTGTWTPTTGTAGVVVVEQDNGAATDIDLVRVYVPRSLAVNGKLFVRLNVVATSAP